jgi:hypothetical protein
VAIVVDAEKPEIPCQLPWSNNSSTKIDTFIIKMGEYENFCVLFGKQDISEVCPNLSLKLMKILIVIYPQNTSGKSKT